MIEEIKPSILLVDDIPANLKVMRRILSNIDAEIIEASSGEEALEKVLKYKFALVLLDVQMPDMNGYEVAALMQSIERAKTIPIIFVTANSTEEINVAKGYDVGAVDYIQKPLDKHILQSKVKIFVELYQKQQEIERLLEGQNEYIEILQKEQAKTEKANETKNIFLANMSHEIRTPLNGIMGMTQLLLRSRLNKKQLEYAKTIYDSSDVLLSLVGDVLDLSKIESGEMDLYLEPTDIYEITKQAMQILVPNAAENNIEFAIDYDRSIDMLQADAIRIRQILLNLSGNAIKFSKDTYVLINIQKIKETKKEQSLRFEVIDGGIGISKDYLGRIFDQFTQADGSTTKKYGGTGLGLSISKKLVDMMGGEIGVASEIGKGSTFWFEVTFSKADALTKQRHLVPAAEIAKKKILIVDDFEVNRYVLAEFLASWGITYFTVPSAALALEAMYKAAKEGKPYDIALIDYMMPEMDGKQLADIIRADNDLKSIVLIMVTGAHKIEDSKRAEEMGFFSCLLKPIYPSDLLNTLIEVLQKDGIGIDHIVSEKDESVIPELKVDFDGTSILVVEDSRVNQAFAKEILKDMGCKVAIAENGKIATSMVMQGNYDIILMDCMMPEMDGYEATSVIRKGGIQIPIVAMTANALKGDREKCLESGMDDYITKPIKSQTLEYTLKKWVHGE